MAMSLRFIASASGGGKTRACVKEILSRGESGAALILIVPEQFTLQTEKELTREASRGAIARAQVLSFQRLAYHVFAKTGGGNRKLLNDSGKAMLLRKITAEVEQSLMFYRNAANNNGFIEKLSDTVAEFRRYGVNQAALEEAAGRVKADGPLRRKLGDICLINRRYEEFCRKNYISGEETLDLLAEKIGGTDFLKRASVWLDAFTGFTPQERAVIGELMETCDSVTVTLPFDGGADELCETDAADYFYAVKRTFISLSKEARERGVRVEPVIVLGLEEGKPVKKPDLKFLSDNFLKDPVK
jgi:ATP-dependent helicase/nuclease subunit B